MPRLNKSSPNNKRGPARNAGQRATTQVPAGIPAWVPELEKWEQANYDGIKGPPPEWVPEPHKKQFYSARGHLFFLVEKKQVSYADIRARFAAFLEQTPSEAVIRVHAKDTKPYDDDLHYLEKLYRLELLGNVEDGLRKLAGEHAVTGYRVWSGPRNRKLNPDKSAIQQIGARYWENNPNAVPKDILASQEFLTYVKGKKRYATRTYLSWLQPVDRRRKKPGRRPRTR